MCVGCGETIPSWVSVLMRLVFCVRQINDFSMVAFVPMNITREESIETVLLHVDHAINYGDDLEPTEPKDDAEDDF